MRPSELLSLVRRGEIKPETLLRKNDSAWFPASDVGGLFEAAVRQEVQYFCPSCGLRVGPPPRTCPKCLRDIGKGEARVVRPDQNTAKMVLQGDAAEEAPNVEQASVQNWLKKKVGNRQKK